MNLRRFWPVGDFEGTLALGFAALGLVLGFVVWHPVVEGMTLRTWPSELTFVAVLAVGLGLGLSAIRLGKRREKVRGWAALAILVTLGALYLRALFHDLILIANALR
jgi:hypothetical protein